MYNPYIVIPFVAWVMAQTIKFSLAAWHGRMEFKLLYASGGMPSGHSAFVSSLAVTALLLEGFNSGLFGVTLAFAAIVMYDSFGVRRSSGEQAAALNALIARQAGDRPSGGLPSQRRLREVLGHSPLEVLVGALIGSLLAILFNLDRIRPVLAFLSAVPKRPELVVYGALFGLLVLSGIAIRILLGMKSRKSGAMRALVRKFFVKTQVIGWLGALAVFAQYERVPYLSWRFWPIVLILSMLAWDVYLWVRFASVLPKAIAQEREEMRRKKWLEPKTKRKKHRA